MLARVVVCYRDTILDVTHVRVGQRFTIGESPAASLTVSDASLPGVDEFELVRMTSEGASVIDPRSHTRALLRAGEVARLAIGELSLHVSLTRAEAPKLERCAVDWGLLASVTAAGVVAAAVALLMRLTPALERVDASPDEPAYARYFRPSVDAAPRPKQPRPQRSPVFVECVEGEVGAGAGTLASREPSGRAGLKKPRRRQARAATPDRVLDHASILGMMASQRSVYQSAWIGAGSDDRDVWGGLDGSVLADGHGEGGLGLVGVGRGGGGTGEGTIGLGSTGLIGRGGSGGMSEGCPVCVRRAKPRLRAERPRVEGALEGSTIHRVTKAKIGQLQACYDTALRLAPKLKGELELQYAIVPEGTVSAVLVEQSPDRALGECMAEVLRRSRFPRTSSSGTIVHQPITLDPR